MKLFGFTKALFFFIFITELLLQSFIFLKIYDNKIISLFYNPYCNQAYWNLNKNSDFKSYFNNEIIYHPLLSLVRKKNKIPLAKNEKVSADNINNEKKIIFFGSSFIDHKIFKKKLIKNKINNKNYALSSYGLDQILLSYQLTSERHKEQFIIFGFLMEDLDRVIFNKRNYPKIKFKYQNKKFVMSNTPITEIKEPFNFDFYLYKFIRNFYFLLNNDFDHKRSVCFSNFKKQFFEYYTNEILQGSKINNQKIIFITFNFLDEVKTNKLNWRHEFILETLKQNKIINIDTKKILKRDSKLNNTQIEKYFNNKDFHLSNKGFELVVKEIVKTIEQYK
jgi:hypothetical protein